MAVSQNEIVQKQIEDLQRTVDGLKVIVEDNMRISSHQSERVIIMVEQGATLDQTWRRSAMDKHRKEVDLRSKSKTPLTGPALT